jgi:hypothetical protein
MCNLQKFIETLNFWIIESDEVKESFLIGSDLIQDTVVTFGELEDWLISINKIGCWYSDEGDIMVTLEDVIEESSAYELNVILDNFMKENILPTCGEEFDIIHKDEKFMEMHDAPMPVSDTYEEVEEQEKQRQTNANPFGWESAY